MSSETSAVLDSHYDTLRIIELLQNVPAWPGFMHGGSAEDFWHWRYSGSVQHGLISVINHRGRAVSHAASLPVRICIGGELLCGAQWSDFCTAPDFRGKGLIEKAVRNLEESEISAGVSADFAFPSPAGRKIAADFGLSEIPCRFKQYEAIIDAESFFSSSRSGRIKKAAYETGRLVRSRGDSAEDIRVEEISSFPSDIDEVMKDFEGDYDIVIRRSMEYLNHRYLHPSGGKFYVAAAERNGKICGYAALRPYETDGRKYMDIADICADSHESASALIRASKEMCSEYGSASLQIWLSGTDWLSRDVSEAGFRALKPREGERAMHFFMRRFDGKAIPKYPVCHLCLGDTDWV